MYRPLHRSTHEHEEEHHEAVQLDPSDLYQPACACAGRMQPGPSQPVETTPAPAVSAPASADASTAEERRNLETFDDLDYNVFSNQKWDELSRSHAADVIVHWPDGHITNGIDVHIDDLKKLFVYVPDTRIKHHEHTLAQDGYTTVSGLMEGTFARPMTTADGSVIQPNGKAFSLPMATIGRWENGIMQEEWLFWDNATYLRHPGLGQ